MKMNKKSLMYRLLSAIPLLFGITFLSFMIMHLAPGDPALRYTHPDISLEDLAQIQINLGLDQPLWKQYVFWLKEALQGNLGYSYISQKPVLDAILERLPATLLLSSLALILIVAIALPLGLLSGRKAQSFFDDGVTFFTFLGMSMPTFWLGLMMILVFSLFWGLLPSSGYMDVHLINAAWWQQCLSILKHLALPLLTTVLGGLAGLTRYQRFAVIGILKQPYMIAARARGLSETRLLYKHAFKNAALPVITILGLSLPELISGSFIIEYIFAWPGLGQLGVNAVFARDYPIIMGSILFASILMIIGNIIADAAYNWVDPRMTSQ